jgi:hypothetical protein
MLIPSLPGVFTKASYKSIHYPRGPMSRRDRSGKGNTPKQVFADTHEDIDFAVRCLDALTRATSLTDDDRLYRPGLYAPPDDSFLTLLSEASDSSDAPSEPDDEEDDGGEVVLLVTAPVPEVIEPDHEAELETEELGEQQFESGSHDDDMFWDNVTRFAGTLSEEKFGVRSLALRRVVIQLVPRATLLSALRSGNVESVCSVLTNERENMEALVRTADARISELESTHRVSQDPAGGVLTQFNSLLDEVLTDHALSLNTVLFAAHLARKSRHREMREQCARIEQISRDLVVLEHELGGKVVVFSRDWANGGSVSDATTEINGLFAETNKLQEEVGAIVKAGSDLLKQCSDSDIDNDELQRQAQSVITRLKELTGATGTLGVKLPFATTNRIQEFIEPLSIRLGNLRMNFDAIDTPAMNPELKGVFTRIETERVRFQQMVLPIRPRIFKGRILREDELRRLILITFHLLSNGTYGNGNPLPGRSKRAGVGILLTSELIDESEKTLVESLIDNMRDEALQPHLLRMNKKGRWWLHVPTTKGRAQAKAWMNDCNDADEIVSKLFVANKTFAAVSKKGFAKKLDAKKEASGST